MSSIIERDGRWHVTLPGPDGRSLSKSFGSQGRAQAWETRNKQATERYANTDEAPDPFTTTLGELLHRYGREVSSAKRGAKEEQYRVNRIAASPLGALVVVDVTSKALAAYRNERLAVVSSSSVRNEMSIIRRTLETARREWGFLLGHNSAEMVTLPPPGEARCRRLEPGEYERLEAELAGFSPLAWAFVRFAIETGMRRGEILSLTWRNVHLGNGTAHLPKTKNGRSRTVALTDGAIEVLRALPRDGERVFPIDASALRWAWDRAVTRAGLIDLRLHDMRHEGISRLFELGLNVPEVASISGHQTAAMLMRYTHPNARELRRKLAGRRLGSITS